MKRDTAGIHSCTKGYSQGTRRPGVLIPLTTSPASAPAYSLPVPLIPTPSQRDAIEAPARATLVLAGPGAGKTFCLIERIHFLIEQHRVDPARICAFTFTNKAAGEIEHRLSDRLGTLAASKIKRGTIHAFCAELLRELGADVLLEPGFGIADEEYQLNILRRIEGPKRWHRSVLNRFSAHRFRGDSLGQDDALLFEQYERYLHRQRVVDFDMLVLKAADLLERDGPGAIMRARWDVVLVDEFQDLNPVQYRVIAALARDHRHIFGVGDDEQSIYSWAGADPQVFRTFMNEFGIVQPIHLEDNKRCPGNVVALARKLINVNTPLFDLPREQRVARESPHPIDTLVFDNDTDEVRWIIDDIRREKADEGHDWGAVALLYRQHKIGERIEAAFSNAGIPSRLAQGRALSDDPIVGYVIAALRVIASPEDEVLRDAFFSAVLPRALYDEARAQAEASRHDLRRQLNKMQSKFQRADSRGRHIRRALIDWRNLEALGKAHSTIGSLVQELLSRRVGKLKSVLDDRHEDISDPITHPQVVVLADRLREARANKATIVLPRLNGIEVALKAMLSATGFDAICQPNAGPGSPAQAQVPHAFGSLDMTQSLAMTDLFEDQQLAAFGIEPQKKRVHIDANDTASLGIALGMFKALQLVAMADHEERFSDFTAIDLETTGRDTSKCEIVEIAAVRVRDGKIAETMHALVKPGIPIEPKAAETHGISEADVADKPSFDAVWPDFHAFCGDDVVVAHNGYEFDFRILTRMAKDLPQKFDLCTYDTLPLARDLFPTSKKLEHLAPMFGIDTGTSHRALDDTKALALVVLALDGVKVQRARKTALVNLLDNLGIALALSDDATLDDEGRMFKGLTRPYALGRYTTCLELYERETAGDLSIPGVEEVIERLGGAQLMLKIRTEKTADERYPQAMTRLRRVLDEIPAGQLETQIALFLERAALSKWDGLEPARHRVNLLTLHSTKGLEFSRVYIVGVEDSQLPGGSPTKGASPFEIEEARRLLYVGMTRTIDRLVMTHVLSREEKETRGHRFLDEMGVSLVPPPEST
jgi:DNA helicase-2/ATP-dependent DNA helicase PcrA